MVYIKSTQKAAGADITCKTWSQEGDNDRFRLEGANKAEAETSSDFILLAGGYLFLCARSLRRQLSLFVPQPVAPFVSLQLLPFLVLP